MSETKLTTYTFELNDSSNEIRIHLDEEGQPHFVVKDIAEALDLTGHSGSSTLIERIPEAFQDYLTKGKVPNSSGGLRDSYLVAEPAFYYLVLTSRAANAFPMCRWVCEDVLPSIRKTGKYNVVENQEEIPEDFINIQKMIHQYQNEVASGILEATSKIRKDSEELRARVENLSTYTKDLRQTVANNDKAIIDNQQGLLMGQRGLYDMIHAQAIPVVESSVKRRKKTKAADLHTEDEASYYKYLNLKLSEAMENGKAQISSYINTCWRRRYGYKLEATEENNAKGMTLLGIAAKESKLKLKFPDTDLAKRLGFQPNQQRPSYKELLKIMEEELAMETGETYTIEKFLSKDTQDNKELAQVEVEDIF